MSFDVQGKDLYMDLDESNLTLSDPTDFSILNVQPIQSIRVWGVGRDNGRYVHLCGVVIAPNLRPKITEQIQIGVHSCNGKVMKVVICVYIDFMVIL